MDLEGWLRSLGLERYEAAFRDQRDRQTGSPEIDSGGPESARRQRAPTPAYSPRCHSCSAGRSSRGDRLLQRYCRATHCTARLQRSSRAAHRNGPRARGAETRCVEMMSAGIANSGNAIVGSCLRHLRLSSVRHCPGVRLFLLTKPWRQVFQRRLSVPGRCLHQNQMRLRWLDRRFPDRTHQYCRQNHGQGCSDTHGRYSVCQAA